MTWDVGTNLNFAALVISLIALVISCGSVLGQYLATADGYRRCQHSVMGPWADLTKRRWRMNEFRLDTLFTTPEFFVKEVDGSQSRYPGISYNILGSKESMEITLTPPRRNGSGSFGLTNWIHFLQTLHEESDYGQSRDAVTALPALMRRQTSWDFMPPEVLRPLASSNFSDVCILTRRLGMKWKTIRPFEGVMTAEAPGHVMNSTTVRGVGTVFQYTYLQSTDRPRKNMYIWRSEADKMGFGILPGNSEFSIPDFQIGTTAEVLERLNEIDPTKKARNHVKQYMEANPGWPTAFADLIPLAAPMLRRRGSTIIRVPAPGAQEIARGPSVLTCVEYGFKSFAKRLQEMECRSSQLDTVLQLYQNLREKHNQVWENDIVAESTDRSLDFLNDVHDGYDATTSYFRCLQNDYPSFRYFNLVKAHITHAVFFWPECQEKILRMRARESFWRAEGMHVYFDYIPKYVESMRDCGFDQPELVKDAWVTLMFRAFCWQRCHFMIEGLTIPSLYYGSRVPVYLS